MSALDFGGGTGVNVNNRNYTGACPALPNSDWCIGAWMRLRAAVPAASYPYMMATLPDPESGANEGFIFGAIDVPQAFMGYHSNGSGTSQNIYHGVTVGVDTLCVMQRRGANAEWYTVDKGASVSAPTDSVPFVGGAIAAPTTLRIGKSPFSADNWCDPLGEIFIFNDRSLTAAEVQAIAAGARPTYTPLVLLPFRSGAVATEVNLGSGGSTYDQTLVGSGFTTDTDFWALAAGNAARAGNQARQRRA